MSKMNHAESAAGEDHRAGRNFSLQESSLQGNERPSAEECAFFFLHGKKICSVDCLVLAGPHAWWRKNGEAEESCWKEPLSNRCQLNFLTGLFNSLSESLQKIVFCSAALCRSSREPRVCASRASLQPIYASSSEAGMRLRFWWTHRRITSGNRSDCSFVPPLVGWARIVSLLRLLDNVLLLLHNDTFQWNP